MKTIRLLTALIFSVFMAMPSIAANGDYALPSEIGPSPDNTISMDFQDANLKTILKIFSQQAGLNFIASQNVQNRTITIYFDGVSVEDALNHIMNANNLVYEQEPGSNIFIVKESGAPAVETLTKIYELKYAQLTSPPSGGGSGGGSAEITDVITGVLSGNGKVIADKRSNSLIITDVPSQFVILEDVLSRLDIRVPQVLIEVEIVETSTTLAKDFGVSWSGTIGAYAGPVHNTVWPLRGKFGKDDSLGEGIKTGGTVSLSGMTASIKALLSNTETRILARPKVLTLNNETALIELTSQTAVASITTTTDTGSSTSTTSTGAERIDTGITLEVTPQINKEGYITMRIEPSVIVPVLSTYFTETGSQFVDPQKRSTKTTVRVKNGETIVIGGLISRENSKGITKVPFLGDLPLLGHAFRYKDINSLDKELLIFITTRIIDDGMYTLASISEREQEKSKAVKEKEIKTVLDLLGQEW